MYNFSISGLSFDLRKIIRGNVVQVYYYNHCEIIGIIMNYEI